MWGTCSSGEKAPSFSSGKFLPSPLAGLQHTALRGTTEGPDSGVDPRPLLGLLRPVP